MARTSQRNLFSLSIGLLLTLLILPSCSLFDRKQDEPSSSSSGLGSAQPEAVISDGSNTAIQTPDQADAEPEPGQPPVPAGHGAKADGEHGGSDLHLVWGYSGVIGPDVWGKLDPTFKLCETGKNQSPIDLKWTKPKKGNIEIDYKKTAATLVDNGHTLQVNLKGGNSVNIRGSEYELKQVHFHSSSEHTLSGNSLPMEAHFVHKNAKGEVAVLGVIIIEGKANPTIQALWSQWPADQSNDVGLSAKFDAESLLPKIKTHYHYMGSFTSPPCTENVNWNVFNTPIEVSKAQLLAFRQHYPSNNRPVQELNKRKVTNY